MMTYHSATRANYHVTEAAASLAVALDHLEKAAEAYPDRDVIGTELDVFAITRNTIRQAATACGGMQVLCSVWKDAEGSK